MSETKFNQFPGVVCELLRKLVDEAETAEANREKAFEDRDEALSRSIEPGISDEEKEQHDAEYGREVQKIEKLGKRFNWCVGEILKTVKTARKAETDPQQPLQFHDAELHMPDFAAKVKKAEKGAKPDEPAKGPDPDQMQIADGVDQQLAASPSELDMREDLKGRLQSAGFAIIGDVAKYVDEGKDLTAHNFSEKEAKEIQKALGSYRSVHRHAMASAESGG